MKKIRFRTTFITFDKPILSDKWLVDLNDGETVLGVVPSINRPGGCYVVIYDYEKTQTRINTKTIVNDARQIIGDKTNELNLKIAENPTCMDFEVQTWMRQTLIDLMAALPVQSSEQKVIEK